MDLLSRIDLMIGEKHTRAKRRKKQREEFKKKTLGVSRDKKRTEAQKQYAGHGSIKDLMKKEDVNEGMDDLTGTVTKSMPYYMKGAQISLKKKGSTFYAGVKEAGKSDAEIKKFANKDDALKWLSGFGIKEITWNDGKSKSKF